MLWTNENVLLYGAIFDVTLIDKKFSYYPISFELTFGKRSNYNKSKAEGDVIAKNRTFALKPTCKSKYFCHLDYEFNRPCFHIMTNVADIRERMYNANIINKMSKELVVFILS